MSTIIFPKCMGGFVYPRRRPSPFRVGGVVLRQCLLAPCGTRVVHIFALFGGAISARSNAPQRGGVVMLLVSAG